MNIAELRLFLHGFFLYLVFGILENYIHFFPENPQTLQTIEGGGDSFLLARSYPVFSHVSV